jgi:hypothetical protein
LHSSLRRRPLVKDVVPGQVDGEGRQGVEGRLAAGPATEAPAEQRVVGVAFKKETRAVKKMDLVFPQSG